MLERGKMDRDLVEFVVIDQLVPKEHLLRKIDAAVDFTQLYEMVEPLYCEDNGRPSIDPVVLFKMVLIQHLYGLPSLRRTADEVSANICYRWFLGYTLQEETPHFSTVSYNFRHRFTEETVDRVFAWILDEVAKAGYRRMTAWINRLNGTCFSKNRIHRIMQAINVHSVIRKQPKKYRKSTPERTAENVLKRDFNASSPNEKWVTDVTEFKWYEGPVCHKLYLSAILDLYDRSVVSHVISRRNDNKLVFQTFDKAIANNQDAKPIFHSDRGFQYTGRVF